MKLSPQYARLYKRSTRNFPYMEHYKYDYFRNPILKDKVSGKGEREPRAVCIEEMTVLFNCLKDNDFDERACTQVIDAFKKCVDVAEMRRAEQRQIRKGLVTEPIAEHSKTDRLPSTVVNNLLKRFPEPK